MSAFNKGDKVRVLHSRFGSGGGDGFFFRVGDVGVVAKEDDTLNAYIVDFNNQGNERVTDDGVWGVNGYALERVEEP